MTKQTNELIDELTKYIIRSDIKSLVQKASALKSYLIDHIPHYLGVKIKERSKMTYLLQTLPSSVKIPFNEYLKSTLTQERTRSMVFQNRYTLVSCAELCAQIFNFSTVGTHEIFVTALPGSIECPDYEKTLIKRLQQTPPYRYFSLFNEKAEYFFLVLSRVFKPGEIPMVYMMLKHIVQRHNSDGQLVPYQVYKMNDIEFPFCPEGYLLPVKPSASCEDLLKGASFLGKVETQFMVSKSFSFPFATNLLGKKEVSSFLHCAQLIVIAGEQRIGIVGYGGNLSILGLLMASLDRNVYVEGVGDEHDEMKGVIYVKDFKTEKITCIFDFSVEIMESDYKNGKKKVDEFYKVLNTECFIRVPRAYIIQDRTYHVDFTDMNKVWLCPLGSAGIKAEVVVYSICKLMVLRAYASAYYEFDYARELGSFGKILRSLRYDIKLAKSETVVVIYPDKFQECISKNSPKIVSTNVIVKEIPIVEKRQDQKLMLDDVDSSFERDKKNKKKKKNKKHKSVSSESVSSSSSSSSSTEDIKKIRKQIAKLKSLEIELKKNETNVSRRKKTNSKFAPSKGKLELEDAKGKGKVDMKNKNLNTQMQDPINKRIQHGLVNRNIVVDHPTSSQEEGQDDLSANDSEADFQPDPNLDLQGEESESISTD